MEKGSVRMCSVPDLRLGSSCVGVGPKYNGRCPPRRHTEDEPCSREAPRREFGVTRPQPKPPRKPTTSGASRGGKGPPQSLRGAGPCQHLDFDLWPPEPWGVSLCCFYPPACGGSLQEPQETRGKCSRGTLGARCDDSDDQLWAQYPR